MIQEALRSQQAHKAVLLALMVTAAFTALFCCLYGGYLAGFPYQVDEREGAQYRSSLAIAQGRNPWAAADAPDDFNVYGLLYPWTAAHLLPDGHRRIRDLRLLSLAALAAAALLVGAAAGRLAGSLLAGAAGGLASMAGYLFFVTPTARCDAFAALFFAAPLALAALDQGWRTLAAACALAVLAFFTKPYAAASGPALCLVLFALGRRRTALAFGAAWLAALVALAAAVEVAWPGCLESTLLLQANLAECSLGSLAKQSAAYLLAGGLPLLALACLGARRFRPPREALAWALPAAAMALLLLWLGSNRRAFLEYHFQLLQPAAVLAAAALWKKRPPGERWLEAGLLGCALLGVRCDRVFLDRLAAADLGPWRLAEARMAQSRLPYAPPLLTSMAADQGKGVPSNGQTDALAFAGRGPSSAALRAAELDWEALWRGRLERAEADLVFSPLAAPLDPGLLRGYAREGRLCLPNLLAASDGYLQCYDVYHPIKEKR